jgi:hypothetical protein
MYIYCKPIVCLVSDTTAFASNQQGGNIQSSSGVRNIQGQDILKYFAIIYVSLFFDKVSILFVIICRHQYIEVNVFYLSRQSVLRLPLIISKHFPISTNPCI